VLRRRARRRRRGRVRAGAARAGERRQKRGGDGQRAATRECPMSSHRSPLPRRCPHHSAPPLVDTCQPIVRRSATATEGQNAMPNRPATVTAAHACSNSNSAAEFLIWKPSAWSELRKYSPTTAPIIASTVPTFSAANRYGSELGRRTVRYTVISDAA